MAQEANFDFNMPPQFEKITQNIRLLIIGFIVVQQHSLLYLLWKLKK